MPRKGFRLPVINIAALNFLRPRAARQEAETRSTNDDNDGAVNKTLGSVESGNDEGKSNTLAADNGKISKTETGRVSDGQATAASPAGKKRTRNEETCDSVDEKSSKKMKSCLERKQGPDAIRFDTKEQPALPDDKDSRPPNGTKTTVNETSSSGIGGNPSNVGTEANGSDNDATSASANEANDSNISATKGKHPLSQTTTAQPPAAAPISHPIVGAAMNSIPSPQYALWFSQQHLQLAALYQQNANAMGDPKQLYGYFYQQHLASELLANTHRRLASICQEMAKNLTATQNGSQKDSKQT